MACINRRTMCLALGGAIVARPIDRPKPWESKPVSDWSKQDIETILSASPWAHAVTLHFPLSPDTIGAPDNGHWDSKARSSEDIEEHRTIQYLVRWDSAKPVREALLRAGRKGPIYAPVSPEAAGLYYILSVIILRPPPLDEGDFEINEKQRARITALSMLRREGHADLHPSEVIGKRGLVLYQFHFLKADPIVAEDGNVEFHTSAVPASLKQVFRLREMKFQGELAL